VDFGRVPDVARVDFSLPSLPPAAPRTEGAAKASPRIFVGAPAWAHPSWVGRVYPRGTRGAASLDAYGAAYDAIELNATGYGVPEAATLAGWRDRVPATFRFCPKVPRVSTHVGPRDEIGRGVASFVEAVRPLGDRLGPIFLQLPPSFGPASLPILEEAIAAVPRDVAVAVELRHPDWFARGRLIAPAERALARRGAAAIVTDVAGRRDVCHASVTGAFAFVRFVGVAPHPVDAQRIDAWAARFAELFARGLRAAFFFVHEPIADVTPEMLAHAADAFQQATGIAARAPRADLEGRPLAP
jgi:uncharacterized protein YecE (DUF72 family)